MPLSSRAFFALLLTIACSACPARAELDVSGQKEFRFRGYRQSGSFNQFIQDNPTYLTDDGFDQSLRLDVNGTLFDNVKLELSFDDSLETREDQKLLASVDGRVWDIAAGRMGLQFDDTQYVLYNKKALALTATGLLGKHLVTLTAARPEGRQRRQTFRGNGAQQEFVLTDASGRTNIRVVQGSDVVHLDSRRLERGRDYEFDYEEGSILFKHHLMPIEPSSLITVEYELAGNLDDTSTGTLLAFRDRYFFEGLDDPSDREPEDEYVAMSVATNLDQAKGGATGPPVESRLTVLGADGQAVLPADMLLRAELAASRLEADSSIPGTASEEGWALDLDLAKRDGRLTFDLTHQAVAPGFQAIGRREFVRLNERSDLIRDVASTRLDAEYELSRRASANVKLDVAGTNLDDDPALPTIDFEAALAGLTLDLERERTLAIRRRAERQDALRPAGISGNQDRDVVTAVANAPLFGLAAQASYENEENDTTLPDGTSTDYLTRRFSLGSRQPGKIGWSAALENQQRPGLGQSASGQLLIDVAPMKTLKGNLSLLRRMEEGRLTPTTTSEDSITDTGELRLRYDPKPELHFDTKATAEQRGRVVRIRDPRLPPPTEAELRQPRTVVTDNPILRLLASQTIDWRPSRRYDHRVQLRANREEDKLTELTFSESQALNYRLKFAPTGRLRFVTEFEKSGAINRLTPLDRDQELRSIQMMNAFDAGLSATLTRRSIEADDKVLGVDENELTHGLAVEKVLSAMLTAEAGVEKKSRTGRFVDDALTARAGVRWSPDKLPLRTEVAVEHSSIDGQLTSGGPLSSYKDRVSVKADWRLNPQTLIEVASDMTKAGPTVAGDPGYEALTGEAKVSVNF